MFVAIFFGTLVSHCGEQFRELIQFILRGGHDSVNTDGWESIRSFHNVSQIIFHERCFDPVLCFLKI